MSVRIWVLFILVVMLLATCGCSSQPLTPEQQEVRDYNRQATAENWLRCKQVYKRGGGVWVTERVISTRRVHYHDMKQDLITNRCRTILGEYWIEQK